MMVLHLAIFLIALSNSAEPHLLIQEENNCPAGWKLQTNRRCCMTTIWSKKLNWTDSRAACKALRPDDEGVDLVSIYDEETQNFVKEKLINLANDTLYESHKFWIGLNEIEVEGEYHWSSGNKLEAYNNFRANHRTQFDRGAFALVNRNGWWVQLDPATEQYPLCEIDGTNSTNGCELDRGCEQICINNIGSSKCGCMKGYTLIGGKNCTRNETQQSMMPTVLVVATGTGLLTSAGVYGINKVVGASSMLQSAADQGIANQVSTGGYEGYEGYEGYNVRDHPDNDALDIVVPTADDEDKDEDDYDDEDESSVSSQ